MALEPSADADDAKDEGGKRERAKAANREAILDAALGNPGHILVELGVIGRISDP